MFLHDIDNDIKNKIDPDDLDYDEIFESGDIKIDSNTQQQKDHINSVLHGRQWQEILTDVCIKHYNDDYVCYSGNCDSMEKDWY